MRTGLTVPVLVCVGAAGVAVGALALSAGGSSDDSEQPAASNDAAAATLVIDDFAFSAVTVAPGETVSVQNADSAPHTATAADGAFDTGTLDAGASGSFVAPATPGDHPFTCEIHPQMSGVVTVQGPQPESGGEAPPDTVNDQAPDDGDDGY